jgi:hypothetical protein
VGDSSVSSTSRQPSGNCDQTRSMISELCRGAMAATLVPSMVILASTVPLVIALEEKTLHQEPIPEFWECSTEGRVKQSQCVGRAGLPRTPRYHSTGN